jgi:hypothetical protein
MADNDKQKFDIPWATLLPIMAAVAGIIVQFRPLVSERPPAPGEKAVEVVAEQDVDARLWQDPLVVAQRKKAELDAEAPKTQVPVGRTQVHDIDALKNLIVQASSPHRRILLVAVMLDSGPYIEQGESRLRARQAVLEGLSESGFVPKDSEHIGFVNWSQDTGEHNKTLIPWEECKVTDDPRRVYPRDTQGAFLLWLPSASFSEHPLKHFAALIGQLVGEIRDEVDVKLIGPANSTGLQDMVKERELDTADYDSLDGLDIISPRATVSDCALLGEQGAVQDIIQDLVAPVAPPKREIRFPDCALLREQGAVQDIIQGHVDPPKHGIRFRRTIATDDLVLLNLISELELRNIDVAHKDEEKHDKIVLLTEWDSPYGRSLAKTFAALASNQSYGVVEEPGHWPTWILSYRYLRGIDGRLPGEQAKPAGGEDKQKSQGAVQPKTEEATEGLDQSDFLRRLAHELKDEQTQWWREDRSRIRAIGLLGSDIYDKLMILRALRPVFRDAVFFTNDFDAHFERRDDWSDVRNLVVASPFGSRVLIERDDRTLFEQHVAPFRDNLQTSMFFGTLVATSRLDSSIIKRELDRQPRMFEIGRHGSVELNQENTRWFRNWFLSHKVWLHLILGAIALLAIVFWIGLSSVDRRLSGGGGSGERLKRTCLSTAFWLVCGVPVIVLLVAWFSESGGAQQEPLAFSAGISIWPSEMLRLIALLLAIHFMIKAHVDLRVNEHEVNERFFPGWSPPSERWHWWNPRLGLKRWQKEHPDWVGSDTPFSAKEAWSAYLVRNQFWPRLIRIGTLFVIYLSFSFAVFTLFPQPVTPARGPTSFFFDFWVALIPAVIAMMILTFYVVDAIRLNSNFIRIFTYGVAKWEPALSLGQERIPPLKEEDLPRYFDIFFVGLRTEAVAPLIWYPIIVLAVMFVARSSFFDNWSWPVSLGLVLALNVMWALGSAMFLRRAAEQLREGAIRKLQSLRIKSYAAGDEIRREMFDELIAEIRGLKKGAFAPLTEQPFIRAILYPSGGLGLVAVVQYFFNTS